MIPISSATKHSAGRRYGVFAEGRISKRISDNFISFKARLIAIDLKHNFGIAGLLKPSLRIQAK